MSTDLLGRRKRYERQPKGATYVFSERDAAIFDAIYHHGPLPPHYLYDFTKDMPRGKNYVVLLKRLGQLYHGFEDGEDTHFLTRPPQLNPITVKGQKAIYDLAPRAEVLLAELARTSRFMTPRTDYIIHRYMGACVSASIELGCWREDLKFVHRRDIFAYPKCPLRDKDAINPMALPVSTGFIVPDNLFAIDYGGKFRFFAVEIDRKTESIDSDFSKSAYGRKLKNYKEALARKTYNDVWGIPNLTILTVTTNATHMQNMMRHLKEMGTAQDRFAFKAKPEFGTNWGVPDIMYDLLTEPWARTTTPFDISKP